jgi:hypothetical protein
MDLFCFLVLSNLAGSIGRGSETGRFSYYLVENTPFTIDLAENRMKSASFPPSCRKTFTTWRKTSILPPTWRKTRSHSWCVRVQRRAWFQCVCKLSIRQCLLRCRRL